MLLIAKNIISDSNLFFYLYNFSQSTTFEYNSLAFNTTINFLPNEYELPSGIFIKQNNNYLIQYPKNQRNKQPKLISWEINYNIETNPRTNKISGVLPYFQNIKPKQ